MMKTSAPRVYHIDVYERPNGDIYCIYTYTNGRQTKTFKPLGGLAMQTTEPIPADAKKRVWADQS